MFYSLMSMWKIISLSKSLIMHHEKFLLPRRYSIWYRAPPTRQNLHIKPQHTDTRATTVSTNDPNAAIPSQANNVAARMQSKSHTTTAINDFHKQVTRGKRSHFPRHLFVQMCRYFEKYSDLYMHVAPSIRKQIAEQTGLSPAQVKRWCIDRRRFLQNRSLRPVRPYLHQELSLPKTKAILETAYHENPFLTRSKTQREKLAASANLTADDVRRWFRRRRTIEKVAACKDTFPKK